MNLVKKIQENIFHHGLFSRGAKIIVGISGGPDSVCLLDALYRLKDKYGLRIVAAHVNYGLRGKDSDRDEQFVKNLAAKYSLPIEIFKTTRHSPQDANLEEKLRKIRYDFFEKIRAKHGASVVAVGHNLNDQAETVLMRIIRGSGLRGLGAIRFRNNAVIRPLLNVPRKEIISYLRKNKIPYRVDYTNLTADFTRNKIRNRLFGHLEKNYNANIQKTLFRLSQAAAEDYAFIRKFSHSWLAANKPLRASKLLELEPAIQKEVLRLAIEEFRPGLREIDSAHLDEILKIARSNKMKRQSMRLKDLKIEKKGDRLLISQII